MFLLTCYRTVGRESTVRWFVHCTTAAEATPTEEPGCRRFRAHLQMILRRLPGLSKAFERTALWKAAEWSPVPHVGSESFRISGLDPHVPCTRFAKARRVSCPQPRLRSGDHAVVRHRQSTCPPGSRATPGCLTAGRTPASDQMQRGGTA